MAHRTQHAEGPASRLRWAARGGMIGPIVFGVVVVVAAALYDGYSHASQKISELGGQGAEFAVLQNANFLLLGILVVGFAWALATTLGPPHRGAVLLGVFGVSSCIANGLLPCDVACVGATPIAQAHNVTGVLGFVAAVGGMLVLARRWRHDAAWRAHVAPTYLAAAVAVGGLAWFIATQAINPAHPFGGVAQRAFVSALLVWITRTAWLLDRELRSGRSTSASAVASQPA